MTVEQWALEIAPGDVVEAPSGLLRVVREVHRYRRSAPRQVWAFFSIQRCSWTKRPYTTYTVGELWQIGYRPLGIKSNLDSEFDRKLLEDMTGNRPKASDCTFRCCDVIGIP